MAIVVYRCDVCKREIDIVRNLRGLERIQRCTITQGCRGKLYQTNLLPDYERNRIPPDVAGLTNWYSRRILFNHEQSVAKTAWTISHDLGSVPVVTVYADIDTKRQEITPHEIVIIDKNNLVLIFLAPYSGIAQLVARQTNTGTDQQDTEVVDYVPAPHQISSGGEITLALRASKYSSNVTIGITFISADATETQTTIETTAPSLLSPWVDASRVYISGKTYNVYSLPALIPEIFSGQILPGAELRIDSINGNAIGDGDMFILLAVEPYSSYDKITNKLIDVYSVTSTPSKIIAYFTGAEFMAPESLIDGIYPLIKTYTSN